MTAPRNPIRMCIGCRQRAPQESLLRLARRTDGQVTVQQFRRRGRGAYLCADARCLEQAVKRRAVERALRTKRLELEPSRLLEEGRLSLRARLEKLEAGGGKAAKRSRIAAMLHRLEEEQWLR